MGSERGGFSAPRGFFQAAAPPRSSLWTATAWKFAWTGADVPGERADLRSPAYLRLNDVIPDHGHLMHLFLLRVPELDAMWHLHPDPAEGGAFALDLPDMPAGRYQVFADVVDPRGYPWTLVGSIDLPQIAGRPLAGDDSAWSGAPLLASAAAEDSTTSALPDGGRMVWQRPAGNLKADVPLEFTFTVQR